MIIYDPNFSGPRFGPTKDDPPLIVDANGVKAFTIAFERLQSIAWWHSHVTQPPCSIQLNQLTERAPRNRVETSTLLGLKEFFGFGVGKGSDHWFGKAVSWLCVSVLTLKKKGPTFVGPTWWVKKLLTRFALFAVAHRLDGAGFFLGVGEGFLGGGGDGRSAGVSGHASDFFFTATVAFSMLEAPSVRR